MYLYNDQVYQNIPERIRLEDGSTRTSLEELSQEAQETLGLYTYQEVTPAYNIVTQVWSGSYDFDSTNKTATKIIVDKDINTFKTEKLVELQAAQAITQQAGYTCTNTIKLQVDEVSLTRWTQLMVGLVAFQPPQVSIRDYDNVVHIVSLADASQMLAEVFVWGQTFLADTWSKKDAILNAESIEDLVV